MTEIETASKNPCFGGIKESGFEFVRKLNQTKIKNFIYTSF
jgi:hypothetical protein